MNFEGDNNEEEIDEDIKALMPMYLESKLKDLATIQDAFNRKDILLIAKLSHDIKGTALSYGQTKLDKVVRAMEASLKENNLDDVEKSIKAMEDLLKNGGK